MDVSPWGSVIPVSESQLREKQKDIRSILPHFTESDEDHGVKLLKAIICPLIETSATVDITPSHRAAACNAVCAVIEYYQTSGIKYLQDFFLADQIWIRIFNIYLERSDSAKAKSMRQVFIVLTSLLTRTETSRADFLRKHATSVFLDIICHGRDRLRAKPALQGLSHFVSKGLASIHDLIEWYSKSDEVNIRFLPNRQYVQDLLIRFLVWVAHSDTVLSASHLIKSYIDRVRQSSGALGCGFESRKSVSEKETEQTPGWLPFWAEPLISCLQQYPEKIQEYKSHVFPYCFKPDLKEYLRFLLYLNCDYHLEVSISVPRPQGQNSSGLTNMDELKVLLQAIQAGKELGIVKEVDHHQYSAIEIHGNEVLLPDWSFGQLLCHPEGDVRLSGLALVVHSAARTRPFTKTTFRLLKYHLSQLHGDTDANFRGEVLTYTQRLFDRLRASTASLAKVTAPRGSKERTEFPSAKEMNKKGLGPDQNSSDKILLDHLEFIAWYLRFLKGELRPTSTYQRHITALKSLLIVMKSGLDPSVPWHILSKQAQGDLNWAHKLHVLDSGFTRLLQDLMLDPFDDVRGAAALILTLGIRSDANEGFSRFLSRAEKSMLNTGRADHADGVARAYSVQFQECTKQLADSSSNGPVGTDFKISVFNRLVSQLEDTIAIAQADLSIAVNGRPVHGTFAALRYIFDQPGFYPEIVKLPLQDVERWNDLHRRVRITFTNFWSCARDTLCNDAPEGYVPEELEEDSSVSTKEILSYSWRGLKEASLLLKTIISTAPIGTAETDMLTTQDFEVLGRLCFSQLADLRHRGAFSTVSQTFASFCRRCITATDKDLRALPSHWYEETLLCIQDKATSITRRSAGIPSLMAGIIGADSTTKSELFVRAMSDLFAVAVLGAENANIQDSRLPQVHALNCIKEIFTTSRLSASSEAYVGEGLDLAAKTMNSEVWPIRNCSLMLFKALIERLLGSNETQDWKEVQRTKISRFSYSSYPNLINILSNILDSGNAEKAAAGNAQATEGVFPALQILQQAPPPDSHRISIQHAVVRLAKSSHWHLREMAARTLASLLRPMEYHDTLCTLMDAVENSENARHGVLLCVRYTLKRALDQGHLSGQFESILSTLSERREMLCGDMNCPFTMSAYLDIVNLCGRNVLLKGDYSSSSTLPLWQNLSNALERDCSSAGLYAPGHALLQRADAELYVLNRITIFGADDVESAESHGKQIQDMLIELAHLDPDTCCSTLEILFSILSEIPLPDFLLSTPRILGILHQIANAISEEAVKATAQFVIAKALANSENKSQFFANIDDESLVATLKDLEHQCLHGSPTAMQSALRLQGFFLDTQYARYQQEPRKYWSQISAYIRLLRRSLLETNPFDIRYAATSSLSGIEEIWKIRPASAQTMNLILGFAFVLYDMLNDDDDEIRDAAAPIAIKLIHSQGYFKSVKGCVPTVACQHLINFIAKAFQQSSELSKEVLRRLTEAQSSSSLFARSVEDMLATAMKGDTALFIQEKQNLFRDEVLENLVWCHILKLVSLKDVHSAVLNDLAKWVMEGIAVLKETTTKEVDGALGWASKPEVFALGIKVICGAEILLNWLPSANQEIDIKSWQVRKTLREFADAGAVGEVHPLWLSKIEKILTDSVVAEMVQLKSRIEEIW